ncbi:Antitoxin YokJ [Bacillus sp. THAF10]|uniref:SMI1/KNR4 family protein n=1 Tax=Bacillus sp. THAF10 TaxID=2587848 RepID=UPI001268B89F|nr:SMI1/KNR4 family protein [Bacillus sp. THAF10]QFT89229.1 Antitoxin YokJ [Bacillus sp. THAF10]
MELGHLIEKVKNFSNCKVHSPLGFPVVEKGHLLPDDLYEFYKICGRIELFTNCDYGITIVSPKEFLLANPVIIGEKAENDISSDWYIIGRDKNNDYLTIDLNPLRLGRCYDSHWEIHGVPGSCPIIANSFTEFLDRIVMNRGKQCYWLQDDYTYLGDAYNE